MTKRPSCVILAKENLAPYQYKREPLSDDETNACESFEEKLVVWTLLDTGLRVSEFATLIKGNVQWQERRLVIHGKGGPYGRRHAGGRRQGTGNRYGWQAPSRRHPRRVRARGRGWPECWTRSVRA